MYIYIYMCVCVWVWVYMNTDLEVLLSQETKTLEHINSH